MPLNVYLYHSCKFLCSDLTVGRWKVEVTSHYAIFCISQFIFHVLLKWLSSQHDMKDNFVFPIQSYQNNELQKWILFRSYKKYVTNSIFLYHYVYHIMEYITIINFFSSNSLTFYQVQLVLDMCWTLEFISKWHQSDFPMLVHFGSMSRILT